MWADDVLAASSQLEERTFELTTAVSKWRVTASGWEVVAISGAALLLVAILLVLVIVLLFLVCRRKAKVFFIFPRF